jgi:hypothetical protein
VEKFGMWFTGEIIGLWFIWSTYMAVKFMIEDGQHQHASFSLHQAVHQNGQVGFVFLIPLFISVIGSVIWAIAVGES